MVTPTDQVQRIPPSGIRRYFELAEEAEDVISLGVGEPDFSAPWAIREAAIVSLEQGRTSYTTNRGLAELRQAISEYVHERFSLEYDAADEILITTGASEAVDLAIRSLVSPGDVVGVPEPTYLSYRPILELAGADVRPIRTTEPDSFKLTRDSLEDAATHEADLLILCYPNNPTGAIMSAADLEPVTEYVQDHDIGIISDEIYAELTYDGGHTSIASFPGMRDRTVVIGGFSKAFAMTGLRLGYALAPAEVADAMNRIHQYTMLSAPTTAQYAALEGLRSSLDAVVEMRKQYNRRRQYMLARFDEMGISCFEAKGAFYVFPECPGEDETNFVEGLLEEQGVAVVPGSVFGEAGAGHLRVSYAASLVQLREAMDRLEQYLS